MRVSVSFRIMEQERATTCAAPASEDAERPVVEVTPEMIQAGD